MEYFSIRNIVVMGLPPLGLVNGIHFCFSERGALRSEAVLCEFFVVHCRAPENGYCWAVQGGGRI